MVRVSIVGYNSSTKIDSLKYLQHFNFRCYKLKNKQGRESKHKTRGLKGGGVGRGKKGALCHQRKFFIQLYCQKSVSGVVFFDNMSLKK